MIGMINLIKQFISIITGWYNFARGNNEELRNERLRICVDCDGIGFDDMFYCKVCDCPLEAKSRVKSEICEHSKGNRWKP